MLSRRGRPDEILSSKTAMSSEGPRFVIFMPSGVSMIGNSSPEKPEPRYFMTRRLRKAAPSTTW